MWTKIKQIVTISSQDIICSRSKIMHQVNYLCNFLSTNYANHILHDSLTSCFESLHLSSPQYSKNMQGIGFCHRNLHFQCLPNTFVLESKCTVNTLHYALQPSTKSDCCIWHWQHQRKNQCLPWFIANIDTSPASNKHKKNPFPLL